VLLACRGQWRGVDLGCGARNAAPWRTARCIYGFGVELGGAEVAAAAAHRLKTDGALLVRPDGFVAWRTEAAAEDPERTLERVLWRLLCRKPGAS
jgi:putative polyketide hydroxylase